MATAAVETTAVETTAAANLFTQTRPKARPHQGTQICTRHRRMTMVSSALLELALEIRSYAFLMSSECRTQGHERQLPCLCGYFPQCSALMRQLSREFEGLWHAELCSNLPLEFGLTLS